MKYIDLPSIDYIKVEDYNLFNKNFDYEVKNGLNLFIGANGLGKTTTTSLIIFAISGFTSKNDDNHFKIDSDYFRDRSVKTDINEKPTVFLKFKIGITTGAVAICPLF